MAKQQAISDEEIIAALLNAGTIRGAAAVVGLSERAVYDRMNRGDFKALYKAAKADIMRTAVFHLNNQLQAAIDTIAEIMGNQDASPAIRLQAAQAILNNAGKFSEQLQRAETRVNDQLEANQYSFGF